MSLAAIGLAVACGGPAPPPAVPPVTTALPDAALNPTEDASAPDGGAYSGHGIETLSAETLAAYRPRSLPADVARAVQSLIDVRAPGIGRLTPDRKALFFTWTITGTSQVWHVDGPKRFPVQWTGGDEVTSIAEITPDGRTLLLQRDRNGEENPGLYAQRVAGGALEPIQHRAGVQTHLEAVSSDSRFVYYSANDRRPDAYAIVRYDLAAKTKEVLVAEDGLWHVADIRDDAGGGARLLLRKETGALTAEYYEWESAGRKLEPRLGVGEKEEYVARYGAHDGELLVLTNKLGEYRRLYSFRDGQLRPIGDDAPFDIEAFDVDRRRTRILYETNESGYRRPHALDARTLRPLALPRFPDADHVVFGPTTPDGRATTVAVDDGRGPVQSYVIDWADGKLEAWTAPSTPEVDASRFARAKLESYPARDGARIPVLVRESDVCRQAAAPCPVVVAFHGGPEGQARPGFNVSAQMFVDAGFVFVEPNVRGSDGYGKAWLHADDGPRRLDVITDIDDAARWARERFAVGGKAPRLGAFGGSYGGYSVLMAMTMFAGAYDAGVDVVGISDLRTLLRNTAPYRRILRMSEYGDPVRDADALAKLSPMTYVDRAKAPLLILQGASDPRVPAGEAVQIHDALEHRGVPCELMIFPDEGHGAQKRENRVLMLGHALAFLGQRLRP